MAPVAGAIKMRFIEAANSAAGISSKMESGRLKEKQYV
jgi:hypothetical protein